jgi:hypothetical protein
LDFRTLEWHILSGFERTPLKTFVTLKAKIIIVLSASVCLFAWWAVPTFIRVRNTPSANPCVNNLRLIDSGKTQWALEHNMTNGADVTWKDILPYIGRGSEGQMPHCPEGGVYILGKIGEPPRCSLGGTHTLPN